MYNVVTPATESLMIHRKYVCTVYINASVTQGQQSLKPKLTEFTVTTVLPFLQVSKILRVKITGQRKF